jgi:hypothetical protein
MQTRKGFKMKELEEKLLQLKDYGYQIWEYYVGHSILIFQGWNTDTKRENIRLTFDNVHYFQFPRSWFGDFYVAPDSEWLEIMTRAGLALEKAVPISIIKQAYQLYKAETRNSTIYVLGHLAQIEYDV